MRLFLAVPITENAKELIYNSIIEETKKINAKWVKKENFHITLKFLGDVNSETIPLIFESMEEITTQYNINSFEITNLGGFPSNNLLRVLFYNITPIQPFINLVNDIDIETKKFGFKVEENFLPHITLARFKIPFKNPTINFEKSINFKQILEGFNLMESKLNRDGPIYSIIRNFKFKGDNNG